MTTVTPSSNTVQRLVRAGVVIVVIGAIVGVVQLMNAPQAQEVWALTAPAPLSSPIDPDNDPPTIDRLHLDTSFYVAGSAPAVLDQGPGASVTDPDSPRFDDGSLSISIIAGGAPTKDVLALATGGDIALSAGTDVGSIVSVFDTPIGTISSSGRGGASLVIDLGTFANPTAATLLVRATTYENTGGLTPTTGTRTVRFTVNDGADGVSTPAEVTVIVTGQSIYLPLVLNAHAASR